MEIKDFVISPKRLSSIRNGVGQKRIGDYMKKYGKAPDENICSFFELTDEDLMRWKLIEYAKCFRCDNGNGQFMPDTPDGSLNEDYEDEYTYITFSDGHTETYLIEGRLICLNR